MFLKSDQLHVDHHVPVYFTLQTNLRPFHQIIVGKNPRYLRVNVSNER